MLDLEMLEQRLNQDAVLRAQFLADPVAVLRSRGLILSLDQARALRAVVAQSQSVRPGVAGATLNSVRLQLTTKAFNFT